MDDKTWHSPDEEDKKTITTDELLQWILTTKTNDPYKEYELVVGSDSQAHGKYYRFATVVCLYRKGKGGMFYCTFEYSPRSNYKGSQHQRIYKEVECSINVAEHIEKCLGIVPTVHIDASPKKANWFTSAFSEQLKGYVMSYGFKAIIKPDSWGASYVANRASH
jgi:predicted RNase H-related nuclease YkuK (DUF458 family)